MERFGPAAAGLIGGNGVSSATLLNPTREQQMVTVQATRPKPMTSVTASASRLTSESIKNRRWAAPGVSNWQEDAWDMLDLVGEQRFLANTLASRLSQARLYVGRLADNNLLEEPEKVEDPQINDVLEALGGSPTARAQMFKRLSVNMFVSGEGWLVGIPASLLPEDIRTKEPREDYEKGDLYLDDLEWKMMSTSEVMSSGTGMVKLKFAENSQIEADPDHLYLIRIWNPHPRHAWEADSPTRSSLPVLRELVGLTMHISAQVDSRLAGAGVFIVPASAAKALRVAAGLDEDSTEDPFTEALIEAMMTPINDRSSASALVPLVFTVPDEAADKFNYFNFSTSLDSEARQLRDEAIRRLALGQDAPPELLLGTGGMNHWGAWLVREDVVSTHIEPPLALICDALTTQYLRPALESLGIENPEEYVVWYDVSHMVTRPNRGTDAQVLYDKGVLSDEALRAANGFDENDAPLSTADPALDLVLRLIGQAPTLAVSPGIPALLEQVRGVMGDGTAPVTSLPDSGADDEADLPAGDDMPTDVDIPDTDGDPAPVAASARPLQRHGTSPVYLPTENEDAHQR